MKIIIDAHALAHRARFAMKGADLSTGSIKTGVIYNFLMAINSLSYFLKSSQFIFIWDSKGSLRQDMYPQYKSKRRNNKTPEEKEFDNLTMPQFQTIRMKVLPTMGFQNSFIQTGLEADDIIAALTIMLKLEKFVIVSRDQDLFQLITGNVTMYDPTSKKFHTQQSVFEEWGIETDRWWEVKAIAGCKTDTVGGVSWTTKNGKLTSAKEKTAIKYLLDTLPRKTDAYKAIEDAEDVMKRNARLTKLPFEGTKCPTLLPEDLKLVDFVEVFEEYNFKSFLYEQDLDDWKNNFGLT